MVIKEGSNNVPGWTFEVLGSDIVLNKIASVPVKYW